MFTVTLFGSRQENLLCLMSNALKYSDRGAIISLHIRVLPASAANEAALTATVDIANDVEMGAAPLAMGALASPAADTMGMVEFAVADTGIGVPDGKKGQLFQPFAQAQRLAGGTGLGLYSLAKRVEVRVSHVTSL